MRRVDGILIAFAVFVAGGVVYLVLQGIGLESTQAGIWTQVFLVTGLIGWLLTYLFRVLTNNMTYHKQVDDYEEAFFQQRWEAMTPEEQEKLLSELKQEQANPQKES